jgi:hypothetical protein
MKAKRMSIVPGAALAVLMLAGSALASAVTQQGDAQNKYAAIIGDYEFDLAQIGQGIVVVNVYVEDDALWVWPETSSEPAKVIPVEGETFKFFVEDDEEGRYEISFLKDDAGKYTKCRVVNESMSLDTTGTKIKQ